MVVALVTLLAVEKQNNMLNSKENDKPKKSFKNYKFANRPKVEVQRKTEVLNLFQHEGNNTVLILQYRFFSFKNSVSIIHQNFTNILYFMQFIRRRIHFLEPYDNMIIIKRVDDFK